MWNYLNVVGSLAKVNISYYSAWDQRDLRNPNWK